MDLKALSRKEFREYLNDHLGNEPKSKKALMDLWSAAKKLEAHCVAAIDAYDLGKPPARIATLIRRQIDFNLSTYLPLVNELSNALEDDFENVLKRIGPVFPGNMAAEVAWDNFMALIEPIFSEIESWTLGPMHEIAGFEDDYL